MSTAVVVTPDALMGEPPAAAPPRLRARIESIDGLRGLVMLLMLVDHAREFFFYGHQVSDPVDLATTSPGLFFTRLAAHLCAPVFVALTGLSAWLYGANKSPADVAAFLFKRGLFLVVLELTFVSFAWTFAFPPPTLFLQVIWAIGSVDDRAGGAGTPAAGSDPGGGCRDRRGAQSARSVRIRTGRAGARAVGGASRPRLHRLGGGLRARTSYPVLPWIGVIAAGVCDGAVVRGGRRRRDGAAVGVAAAAGCWPRSS